MQVSCASSDKFREVLYRLLMWSAFLNCKKLQFLNLCLITCPQNVTTYYLTPVAACLLRSWVRIPPGAWIFVCCECRVLSGRGLCDELITRPGEFYRLCCVVVCDLETARMGAPYIYIYMTLEA